MSNERVLVTGGTGYVAGWVLVRLLESGYRVRTTVRSLAREQAVRDAIASQTDPGDGLEVVAADLTADAGWDTAMADIDYVLHVASPLGSQAPGERADLITPAVEGTRRVLAAAVGAGV